MEPAESFDEFEEQPETRESDRLTLDLDGWEGPLDLLLTLARSQKVDLTRISILALVEQYLAFIADAKKLKLEIAAEMLDASPDSLTANDDVALGNGDSGTAQDSIEEDAGNGARNGQ